VVVIANSDQPAAGRGAEDGRLPRREHTKSTELQRRCGSQQAAREFFAAEFPAGVRRRPLLPPADRRPCARSRRSRSRRSASGSPRRGSRFVVDQRVSIWSPSAASTARPGAPAHPNGGRASCSSRSPSSCSSTSTRRRSALSADGETIRAGGESPAARSGAAEGAPSGSAAHERLDLSPRAHRDAPARSRSASPRSASRPMRKSVGIPRPGTPFRSSPSPGRPSRRGRRGPSLREIALRVKLNRVAHREEEEPSSAYRSARTLVEEPPQRIPLTTSPSRRWRVGRRARRAEADALP